MSRRSVSGTCRTCHQPYGGLVVLRMVWQGWVWDDEACAYTITRQAPAGWFPDCGECHLCWKIPPYAVQTRPEEELPF